MIITVEPDGEIQDRTRFAVAKFHQGQALKGAAPTLFGPSPHGVGAFVFQLGPYSLVCHQDPRTACHRTRRLPARLCMSGTQTKPMFSVCKQSMTVYEHRTVYTPYTQLRLITVCVSVSSFVNHFCPNRLGCTGSICLQQIKINNKSSRVIWEECVATHHGRKWTRLLRAMPAADESNHSAAGTLYPHHTDDFPFQIV